MRILGMSTANPEIGEVATTSRDWASKFKDKYPEIDEGAGTASTRYNRYESIKPGIDFALALAMLFFTAPIIILCMLLMRLGSRGPWVYAQKRLGLGGAVFTMYKIRTMYQDSECDRIPRWCVPGDPRVTPVGRFLRWSHIDELPQLINVLKGEMSLVGPRPERPEFLEQLERALPNYRERLLVRPGLTGLAQVQQPSDTDLSSVHRKLNYDLCYVEQMSLRLDVRLLAGTVLKCLGVPFGLIGRIFQLPNPIAEPGGQSLLTNPS
jgi:lipopolysaccharide/colanic/teichoic acid biosynthesis glycosyltransferase